MPICEVEWMSKVKDGQNAFFITSDPELMEKENDMLEH